MSLLLDIHVLLWAAAGSDRLVAQAEAEGFLLLTVDAQVAQYPGPVKCV